MAASCKTTERELGTWQRVWRQRSHAHLALCEVLCLHDVVKQLSSLAQLHDDVHIVLVFMRALHSRHKHKCSMQA